MCVFMQDVCVVRRKKKKKRMESEQNRTDLFSWHAKLTLNFK